MPKHESSGNERAARLLAAGAMERNALLSLDWETREGPLLSQRAFFSVNVHLRLNQEVGG